MGRLHVTLKFSDGSSLKLNELTMLLINKAFITSHLRDIEVQLKIGEIKAQVKHETSLDTSFKIRTAMASAGVRGTAFGVFYDPGSRSMVVSTLTDEVTVTPTRAGAKTTIVPAGKEVEVTPAGTSRLAPLGKADARGGIDHEEAYALTSAAVAPSAKQCGLDTSLVPGSFSIKPTVGGWLVTVNITGTHRGAATWLVSAGKVTPVNPLAKTIAAGCPGSKPAKPKPGRYSGQTGDDKPLSFDVTPDGATVTNLSFPGHVTCTDGTGWTWTITSTSTTPIGLTLGFVRTYTGGLTINDPSITNVNVAYTLAGSLTTTGTATGTFQINHISWDQNGTSYDCTGSQTAWTARLGS